MSACPLVEGDLVCRLSAGHAHCHIVTERDAPCGSLSPYAYVACVKKARHPGPHGAGVHTWKTAA